MGFNRPTECDWATREWGEVFSTWYWWGLYTLFPSLWLVLLFVTLCCLVVRVLEAGPRLTAFHAVFISLAPVALLRCAYFAVAIRAASAARIRFSDGFGECGDGCEASAGARNACYTLAFARPSFTLTLAATPMLLVAVCAHSANMLVGQLTHMVLIQTQGAAQGAGVGGGGPVDEVGHSLSLATRRRAKSRKAEAAAKLIQRLAHLASALACLDVLCSAAVGVCVAIPAAPLEWRWARAAARGLAQGGTGAGVASALAASIALALRPATEVVGTPARKARRDLLRTSALLGAQALAFALLPYSVPRHNGRRRQLALPPALALVVAALAHALELALAAHVLVSCRPPLLVSAEHRQIYIKRLRGALNVFGESVGEGAGELQHKVGRAPTLWGEGNTSAASAGGDGRSDAEPDDGDEPAAHDAAAAAAGRAGGAHWADDLDRPPPLEGDGDLDDLDDLDDFEDVDAYRASARRTEGLELSTLDETAAGHSASAAPLPPEWSEAYDPVSGQTYYHSTAGETTWTRPSQAGSTSTRRGSRTMSRPRFSAVSTTGTAAASGIASPLHSPGEF